MENMIEDTGHSNRNDFIRSACRFYLIELHRLQEGAREVVDTSDLDDVRENGKAWISFRRILRGIGRDIMKESTKESLIAILLLFGGKFIYRIGKAMDSAPVKIFAFMVIGVGFVYLCVSFISWWEERKPVDQCNTKENEPTNWGYCPYCGMKDQGTPFCPNCGRKA